MKSKERSTSVIELKWGAGGSGGGVSSVRGLGVIDVAPTTGEFIGSLTTSDYLNKNSAGLTLNTDVPGAEGQVLAKSATVGVLNWITPGSGGSGVSSVSGVSSSLRY